MLATLDAHAHLDIRRHPAAYRGSGFVLAQTMSLAEAERTRSRRDARVAFGVGCHPRVAQAQAAFDEAQFAHLLAGTALVGEVGLDAGSRVPVETQLATLRAILRVVVGTPRIVSLHSYRSTGAILDELRDTPIAAPILHWWTGSARETSDAVELGCYFSVHSTVARRTTWRTRVPLDRILLESDHGWNDPPVAIPLRIGWVEHLVAQQYRVTPAEVRAAGWRNLARIVEITGTLALLPPGLRRSLAQAQADSA
jgi:TatD DNase family protein